MARTPKTELPGTAKAKTRQRAAKVASVRVWPRKRRNGDSILYCTVTIPGQKPSRKSTGKRNQSAAEEFAGLLLKLALHPKPEKPAPPQEVQLDLPPPQRCQKRRQRKLEPVI